MDRVFESGASASPPAAPASPSTGYAQAGNPGASIAATKPGPYWYHMITEELRQLIVAAGLTPNHTNTTQIAQAVQTLIAQATGNDYKASVRVATTANIASLAGGAPNTLDGIALVANDRILVKDQATGSQNGIYMVTTLGTGANGTWTRAGDADEAWELTSGALVSVQEGTANADTIWMLATDGAITIGTTALVFVRKDYNQSATSTPPVRQTVLSGPVDANGFPAFGGSTGGTVVTAAGTLRATAAAGGDANYTGSIVNPSWTGLSINGTMYLYLDITSAGVVTPGSTPLAPVYQWGGAYAVANGQNTFNIQEMTMKVGNGATAAQVTRVFVGEVTVAAGVVSAIVWYALMGRYDSGFTATLPGVATAISRNHNIGTNEIQAVPAIVLECLTAEFGYAVGERLTYVSGRNPGTPSQVPTTVRWTRNTVAMTTGDSNAWTVTNATSGGTATLTAANWKYKLLIQRGW